MWWIWLIIAVVLIVLEMLTLDLVLLMAAGGALAAGLTALWITDNILIQVIVWAVVSLVLMLTLRKWALTKMRGTPSSSSTNSESYVGKSGVALTAITATGGRIKFLGEVWTARVAHGESIAEGDSVRVLEIDGATAVIEPHNVPTQ